MIYEYNEKDGILKINNETVYLTEKENQVFGALYYANDTIDKESLNDIIANGYMFNDCNYVRTIISRLRTKLKDNFEIYCVSNKGYKIKPNYEFDENYNEERI